MISALMTVYNGEKYIQQSINSILQQTYQDFELIIVDDGSTDRTRKIIHDFKDERIKLVGLNKNHGVGAAIKEGLKYINREYIAKVDADDIYTENRFELQLDTLQREEDISIVDGLINYFPDNEKVRDSTRYINLKNNYENQINSIYRKEELSEKIYWFPCITHSTLMFRRDVLSIATYNEKLKIGEDYDFYYKLNKKGVGIVKLPTILANIRISEESTTVREISNMYIGVLDIKEEEFEIARSKKAFIWGTGELGNLVQKYLGSKGYKLKGFIDNNQSLVGEIKWGHMVYSKEILDKNSFIFVASTYGKFDIVNELKRKGYKHLEDFVVIF